MARYKIVKNGIIVNMIECDAEFAAREGALLAADSDDIYRPESVYLDTWLISVGAFYDRFGAYKIPILASDDAVIQALVKDAQVRKHIDLQRSDLPTMLDVLIAKGFSVDKTTILGTPAATNELP
jgi:hypothetical protein